MATTTRTRKTTAKASSTAPAAPAAVPVAPTTEAKPKRVPAKLIPVAGCSLLADGVVHVCDQHKTYGDPHCRRQDCPADIRRCTVHELQKGGTVLVTPQQQPQARARRRTR